MREIVEMKEIQDISLKILEYIDSVCKKKGIGYYLAYGTCLGAVRHDGFIPWDDDIDIYMYRKEYMRFTEAMNEESSKYKLLYLDTNPDYSLPLPKVVDTTTYLIQNAQKETCRLGVYVDVFILDNIPDHPLKQAMHLKKLMWLERCWTYAQYNDESFDFNGFKGKVKQIIRHYARRKGPRYFAEALEKQARKYSGIECKKAGAMIFSPNRAAWERIDKVVYGKAINHMFEGRMYPIPENADEYLTTRYGDYMTLPPVEKRCSHHGFKAYRID